VEGPAVAVAGCAAAWVVAVGGGGLVASGSSSPLQARTSKNRAAIIGVSSRNLCFVPKYVFATFEFLQVLTVVNSLLHMPDSQTDHV
jgi:hypothetical protein